MNSATVCTMPSGPMLVSAADPNAPSMPRRPAPRPPFLPAKVGGSMKRKRSAPPDSDR